MVQTFKNKLRNARKITDCFYRNHTLKFKAEQVGAFFFPPLRKKIVANSKQYSHSHYMQNIFPVISYFKATSQDFHKVKKEQPFCKSHHI